MKIAFCDTDAHESETILKWKVGKNIDNLYVSEKPLEDLASYDYDAVSIFITSKVDADTLGKLPKLKFIFTRSTGVDHIDLNECKKLGITVCNVPDYGDKTVAEFTMFLMLSLFRKVKKIEKYYEGRATLDDVCGNDVNGKTLGIIGAGRIGTNVAKLAMAFGMNVLYFNRSNNKELDSLQIKKLELNSALANSDVISLHLPLTASTRHIINKSNITFFKKDALIINTARGALIDTEALIDGIENRTIGGAALDVIEGEEFAGKELDIIKKNATYQELKQAVENSILRKYDNVILTPHIAYDSKEAVQRIIDETLNNIDNLSLHRQLNNVV